MDADEREIYQFLKSWGGQPIAAREICRRASSKQRFQKDPEWAKPILIRMVGRGILESNSTGHYHIKRISKKSGYKQPASPDTVEILEEGVEKTEAAGGESDIGPDECPDQL